MTFLEELSALALKHKVGWEEIIDAVAEGVAAEKDHFLANSTLDPADTRLVASCLDSCVDHLRNAALDYYVSTK